MAIKGQSITVTYRAWNTSTNAYVTGDAANHAIRVMKDGTDGAATNAPAEVSAANRPGEYKLTLTASEMTASVVSVGGKSSTANVVLFFGGDIITEQGILPAGTTPGATDGLLIAGSNASLTVTGGVTFTNAAGDGFVCSSTGGNGHGALFQGNGLGEGWHAAGGASAAGIRAAAGNGAGASFEGAGNGYGLACYGSGAGAGILGFGGNTGTDAAGALFQAGNNTSPGLWIASGNTLSTNPALVVDGTVSVAGATTLAAVTTSGTVTFNAFTVSGDTTLTGAVAATNAGNDIRGAKLAATGLDLVIPPDPGTTTPALGTATLPAWIGYFGAWSVNEVDSTATQTALRNTGDTADLTTYAVSDDGTTFVSGHGA